MLLSVNHFRICALVLLIGANSSAAGVAAVVPGAAPSIAPILPLAPAAVGECGPVGSGPDEFDGRIDDPQIKQNSTTDAFQQSTAIVFPAAADKRGYVASINAQIAAAKQLALDEAAAQQSPSPNVTPPPNHIVSDVNAYSAAAMQAGVAYVNIASQAESAYLGSTGEFQCKGLSATSPLQLLETLVTEFFLDSQGQTITRYYTVEGFPVPSLASGAISQLFLVNCLGSVPYSTKIPTDNCPTRSHRL